MATKYNRGRKSKGLKEATDMTGGGAYADIVAPPRKEGDPTGQSKALSEQAGAISPVQEGMPAAGGMPNIRGMSPINLGGPTQNISEPNTSGIPLGPGDNGANLIPTDTVDNFIWAAREQFPDPIWDELLES
jgi:hypothetical protein